MKIVRKYLTSEELSFIINAMLEKDNALDREVVKVGLVAQILCDDIGDDVDNCNDIYDKVVADDSINFSAIVNNYDIIDIVVDKELGVNNILKDFVTGINEKLDNATKNLNLDSAIKQLREIADKEGTENGGSKKVQNSRRTKAVSNE